MTVSKNEQQWLSKLDDLVAFRKEHGTWPRKRGADVPEGEATLGIWLSNQRTRPLTAERRQLLDIRAPGWEGETLEQQWVARLDELVTFRARHGTWPRGAKPGVPKREATLGTWLVVQRSANTRGNLTDERRSLLDERAPGWAKTRKSELEWLVKLHQLVAFRTEHGTWPRKTGPGVPEGEAAVGHWLNNQRSANTRGNLTDERRSLLDERALGWTETRMSEQAWLTKLNQVVAFRTEHGTWPRKAGPGVPQGETALGSWLSNQRHTSTRADLTTERRQLLDARAPGWAGEQIDRRQAWLTKLDQVVAFRADHDAWPRVKAPGVPEREGGLGYWLSHQRVSSNRGDLTAERRSLLDERAPGWLIGNRKDSERWLTQDEKVDLLVRFYDEVCGGL